MQKCGVVRGRNHLLEREITNAVCPVLQGSDVVVGWTFEYKVVKVVGSLIPIGHVCSEGTGVIGGLNPSIGGFPSCNAGL